jgi:two-component system, cell cycle sensor histidine kinase and response regulator CckA
MSRAVPRTVLLIEDNDGDARLIRELLREAPGTGFDLDVRETLASALDRIRSGGVDVVLVDLGLPDSQGIDTLRRVHAAAPDVPAVVLTGFADEELATRAVREGAQDYLVKGRGDGELLARALTYAIERHEARVALERKEQHFRALIENALDFIALLDERGAILYQSASAELAMGYGAGDLVGTSAFERIHPHDRTVLDGLFEKIARTPGESAVVGFRFLHADGTWRTIEGIARNLLHHPAVRAVVFNGHDVTDRMFAEQRLTTEQTLRHAIERAVASGVVAHDRDGRTTYVNGAFCRMVGWSEAELLGAAPPFVYWPPEEHGRIRAAFERTLSGEAPADGFELTFWRKNGQRFDALVLVTPLADDPGPISGWVASVTDVTRLRRAESAVKVSEQQYRLLAENASDVIWMLGVDLSMQYLSPSIQRLRGYTVDEAMQQSVADVLTPASLDVAMHALREELSREATTGHDRHWSRTLDLEMVRKDGSTVWTESRITLLRDDDGLLSGFLGVSRDISERKAAEEALRKSEEERRQLQKMEAIGRLAGGVAHDFNNMLTVILGRAGMLLSRLHREDPVRREIELIQTTGQRAASLTRQLLAFSRKQILQPKVLDVNGVVSDLDKMLRRLIGEDIELVTELSPFALRVRADEAQLQQVVLNLAVNARDAMPSGGRLRIATAGLELGDSEQHPHGLTTGRWVVLTVADNGCGMPPDVQSRVFEPFFTTKEHGTGLGLATVYGIVKQHDGEIVLESIENHGTTFTIYLPTTVAAIDLGRAAQSPALRARSQATILIVEDEADVREILCEVLEDLGYRVLPAADAVEALATVAEHGRTIDLVVTDIVMPGMNGPDLVARLRRTRAGLRAVYISGYTDGAISEQRQLPPGTHFLSKPFSPESLATRVRDALA